MLIAKRAFPAHNQYHLIDDKIYHYTVSKSNALGDRLSTYCIINYFESLVHHQRPLVNFAEGTGKGFV